MLLLKALKNGELIISPDTDPRQYNGKVFDLENIKNKVIVIKESKKGKNLSYLDLNQMKFLTRNEFLYEIKLGKYPRYEIRIIRGQETPVSKKDDRIPNNLG